MNVFSLKTRRTDHLDETFHKSLLSDAGQFEIKTMQSNNCRVMPVVLKKNQKQKRVKIIFQKKQNNHQERF